MSLSQSFQEIIEKRRSNRKFDPDVEVPDEVIQRSLERSILSPNSSNMQLWAFEPDGRGGQRYTADVTGSTVGLVTFGDELIAYAQVIPDQAEISQPRWQAHTALIPPEGSDVVLILKPYKP